MSRNLCKGFTLLEVVLALGILASAFTILLGFHSRAMIFMKSSREITTATMLAGYKIRDVQLAVEKDMAKGELTSSDKEESGRFDELGEEFKDFRWSYKVSTVDIPLPPAPSASEGEEGAAMAGGVYQVMKIIADEVSKATREITVTVEWGPEMQEKDGRNPRQVTLTTHLVRM